MSGSGSGYSGSNPRPRPPGPRPSPVKIITPDGETHAVSAQEFKHRAPPDLPTPEKTAALAEEMNPSEVVSLELLEEQTMRTLYRNMRHAEKLSERTAAALGAIKFMAIKYKLGPEFGADLDHVPTE